MPAVRVHALLDGRDTPPSSGFGFVAALEARLAGVHPDARIATVGGRYFAMDRDKRWDRVERGYDAIVHGVGEHAPSATAAIAAALRARRDRRVRGPDGHRPARRPDGRVRDGDPIVHANFRADRARQLVHALADAGVRRLRPVVAGRSPGARADLRVVTMTEYEAGLPVAVAFPPEEARSLAEAFSEAGWRQFHVAETEKYAHVTYFFNGGVEKPWPGEDRLLIPSPKVATYDLAPEMSAPGVTDALVEAIGSGRYDFIVANYANPDMVGHTGVWDATLEALAAVDTGLGRIVGRRGGGRRRRPRGTRCAPRDHRRPRQRRRHARRRRRARSRPIRSTRSRSCSSVAPRADCSLADGVLADVAPTLLEFAGLPRWDGMTGRSRVL